MLITISISMIFIHDSIVLLLHLSVDVDVFRIIRALRTCVPLSPTPFLPITRWPDGDSAGSQHENAILLQHKRCPREFILLTGAASKGGRRREGRLCTWDSIFKIITGAQPFDRWAQTISIILLLRNAMPPPRRSQVLSQLCIFLITTLTFFAAFL